MVELSQCVGCSACSNICPQKCIEMKKDKLGFMIPYVDKTQCINCGMCDRVCPIQEGNDLKNEIEDFTTEYYAGWAHPNFMNDNSTSGGIATLLSKIFIQKGKVVGARFSQDFRTVEHIIVDDDMMCDQLAGSKYVQSNTEKVFPQIRRILDSGEKILYIGTACQVAGLKKYVGENRLKNLYTIDFMCHGVPSPEIWKKYVDYIETKQNSNLVSYNFRSKDKGWGVIRASAKFSNNKNWIQRGDFNLFHSWFGKHLSLRDSCFTCFFRSEKRVSDLTIADFWGIEKYYPNLSRKQGVSAIIVNSIKGKKLIDMVQHEQKIELYEVSHDSIWKTRSTALKNFSEPTQRSFFINDFISLPFDVFVRKYPSKTYKDLIKEKMKIIQKKRRRN